MQQQRKISKWWHDTSLPFKVIMMTIAAAILLPIGLYARNQVGDIIETVFAERDIRSMRTDYFSDQWQDTTPITRTCRTAGKVTFETSCDYTLNLSLATDSPKTVVAAVLDVLEQDEWKYSLADSNRALSLRQLRMVADGRELEWSILLTRTPGNGKQDARIKITAQNDAATEMTRLTAELTKNVVN